ncbi:MAG: phosphatase [Lachnospiraceae bacterium]
MKYVLDMHSHTLASGHAYSTITEMAKAASEKGLELLGITEHAPMMPGSCGKIYFQNFRVIPREKFGVKLMFGVELNIMDYNGNVDLEDDILVKSDIRIASLHYPCIKPGTKEQNTLALIKAMRNKYVDIIGHPDDSHYPLDYELLVKAAKKYSTILEVNNSSLHPRGARQNARENLTCMLTLCEKYQVPIIMDSDSHIDVDVGNHNYSMPLLEELHFPEELILNRSVDVFLDTLEKNRQNKAELLDKETLSFLKSLDEFEITNLESKDTLEIEQGEIAHEK